MKKCAILTMDSLDDFECYDYLIEKPLMVLGWKTQLVSWHEKNVDWQQFDAVMIRSPWDYQDNAEEFVAVLKLIEKLNVPLENSLRTVQWNVDKIYLQSLLNEKVNIVPTLWESNFSAEKLDDYFSRLNCEQLVIKPRISAGADDTFWLKKGNTRQYTAALESIFSQGSFMVQPFIHSVVTEGEFSLFYFNGHYSHAILKIPKANDFRVQEEHGGCLKTIQPEESLLNTAKHALNAITHIIGEVPLYARIDLVRIDNHFALMEAELIEPSLYFNMDSKAAKRFAQAFVNKMAEKPQ